MIKLLKKDQLVPRKAYTCAVPVRMELKQPLTLMWSWKGRIKFLPIVTDINEPIIYIPFIKRPPGMKVTTYFDLYTNKVKFMTKLKSYLPCLGCLL